MSNTRMPGAEERITGAAQPDHASLPFNRCIELCNACAVACNRCAAACVEEASSTLARCIALDLDCAAICVATADAMARNSENAGLFASLCADVCRLCAAECADHDMDHCRRCAQACQLCEAECQRVASA